MPKKPHIFRIGTRWHCRSSTAKGAGSTPVMAYFAYLIALGADVHRDSLTHNAFYKILAAGRA